MNAIAADGEVTWLPRVFFSSEYTCCWVWHSSLWFRPGDLNSCQPANTIGLQMPRSDESNGNRSIVFGALHTSSVSIGFTTTIGATADQAAPSCRQARWRSVQLRSISCAPIYILRCGFDADGRPSPDFATGLMPCRNSRFKAHLLSLSLIASPHATGFPATAFSKYISERLSSRISSSAVIRTRSLSLICSSA